MFFVYFIECVGHDFVKIGYSKSVHARLRSLRPSTPFPLKCVGFVITKSRALEKMFHRRFRSQHYKGEWYHKTGALKEFLETTFSKFDYEKIYNEVYQPELARQLSVFLKSNRKRLNSWRNNLEALGADYVTAANWRYLNATPSPEILEATRRTLLEARA